MMAEGASADDSARDKHSGDDAKMPRKQVRKPELPKTSVPSSSSRMHESLHTLGSTPCDLGASQKGSGDSRAEVGSSSGRQQQASDMNPLAGSDAKKRTKRKRSKRRKKSPDAPKHPSSPFLIFAKHNTSTVPKSEIHAIQTDGGKKRGGLMTILGKRWREMPEEAKLPYIRQAEAEKEAYRENVKAHKAQKSRIDGPKIGKFKPEEFTKTRLE
mmetsp:Transcript_6652/g.13099  ORF Transcript_6652/g.13099 Transcript_6652/m.13099 type:complete len:214 (-) Transcript_6652:284-925(-)